MQPDAMRTKEQQADAGRARTARSWKVAFDTVRRGDWRAVAYRLKQLVGPHLPPFARRWLAPRASPVQQALQRLHAAAAAHAAPLPPLHELRRQVAALP